VRACATQTKDSERGAANALSPPLLYLTRRAPGGGQEQVVPGNCALGSHNRCILRRH